MKTADAHVDGPVCQIKGLAQMAEPLGTAKIAWQYRNRLRRLERIE